MGDGQGCARPSRSRQRWTAEEDDQLRFLIACGWSARRCAGVLHRTINSVYKRLEAKGGIDALRHEIFATRSVRELSALLGVPYRLVKTWIDDGWLRAHRNYAKRSRRSKRLRFLIPDEALEDFLTAPRSWLYWVPEQITDPDWRMAARAVRARYGSGRFWTTFALAQQCGVHQRTVQLWIAEHRVAAWHAHERWYVWADECGRPVPMPDAVRADLEQVRREQWERRGYATGAERVDLQLDARDTGDAEQLGQPGSVGLNPYRHGQLLSLVERSVYLAGADEWADSGELGNEGSSARAPAA